MKVKLLALYCFAMITACFANEMLNSNGTLVEISKMNIELSNLIEAERTLPRTEAEALRPRLESIRREIRQAELARKLDPDAGGQPH